MKDRLQGVKTLNVTGILDEFDKDAVVAAVDFVALFKSFGVKLVKKGKSYMGVCPWHKDLNPSLSVDPVKKLYHCFGCGESGDAITLVEKMKGYSFKEALSYLRNLPALYTTNEFGTKTFYSGKNTQTETTPRTLHDAGHVTENHFTHINLSVVAEYYKKKLPYSDDARDYLQKRGLDAALFMRFNVGYADDSIASIVGDEQREDLVDIGILDSKYREHFSGCVVFPITDELGNVVGMYGRSINDSRKTKHLYLPGAHKGIFNRKASKVYNEIILTESIIDALSLVALGFENTQSLYGTNGFTQEHLQILKDDRVKKIILALDNDDAGRKASATLKKKLLGEGFAVSEIFPPEGKDWNEYLTTGGTTSAVKELFPAEETMTPTQSPSEAMRVTKEGLAYVCVTNDVTYRVSGVKDMFVGSLRVAIKASSEVSSFVDTLDLYSARGRAHFSMNLSKASGIESSRIEKDLVVLLEYFEAMRDKALFVGKDNEKKELTEEEKTLGLSLLKDPQIFERIVTDMETLGYVGEEVNKKLLYLAASSRILDDPISVLILSQSSAGKSYLVDTVKRLIPEEDVVSVTSLSDQALNYVEDLMHKFLILGEAVHSEVVEHQIREMLSGKELSRLVAVKDEKTGVMKSRSVKKPVIVSAVMSGTNNAINPENASRCFVIAADESREQTRRIHLSQRHKHSLERYAAKEKDMPEIIRTHHAAQKMLKKVRVVNPFAHYLDFPDALMRTRRDHDRFMDLIACVCFVRQYQKVLRQAQQPDSGQSAIEYIECDMDDYKIAYEIMVQGVLSHTMGELPSGSLILYEEIRRVAKEAATQRGISSTEVHFIQRDLRDKTGLGGEFIKKHLRVLVEYEYVQIASGKMRGTRCSYRLRIDEPAEAIDYSMIPSPEQMAHSFHNPNSESGYNRV
jgi:DNA primase catalytic core